MTKQELEKIKIKYPEKQLGRAKNLSNRTFGKLHPLYRTVPPNQKATYWVCLCDCGSINIYDAGSLTAGRTKSCGCIQKQDILKQTEQKWIGQIINNWTILKKDPDKPRNWICECNCPAHTIKSMRIDTLKLSKGCPSCSAAQNKLVDLTGKKFGHWTVLKRGEGPTEKHTYWLCECDCNAHTQKNIDAYKLKNGISTSCGCDTRSKGENIIAYILKQNNIKFEQQKIFPSCKLSDYGIARFDFYIDNKYLIEYDGQQHFILRDSGWNTEEKLQRTKERDQLKNQWCKDNNIPLIRIPYTHLKDLCINDLKLETSKFVV